MEARWRQVAPAGEAGRARREIGCECRRGRLRAQERQVACAQERYLAGEAVAGHAQTGDAERISHELETRRRSRAPGKIPFAHLAGYLARWRQVAPAGEAGRARREIGCECRRGRLRAQERQVARTQERYLAGEAVAGRAQTGDAERISRELETRRRSRAPGKIPFAHLAGYLARWRQVAPAGEAGRARREIGCECRRGRLRAQERQVARAQERYLAGEAVAGRAQTGDAERISRELETRRRSRAPGKIPFADLAGYLTRWRQVARAGEAGRAQTGDAEKISRELETRRSPAREL